MEHQNHGFTYISIGQGAPRSQHSQTESPAQPRPPPGSRTSAQQSASQTRLPRGWRSSIIALITPPAPRTQSAPEPLPVGGHARVFKTVRQSQVMAHTALTTTGRSSRHRQALRCSYSFCTLTWLRLVREQAPASAPGQ